MVVVGNKVDLAKTDRAVSKEEGKALADEFGGSFLEVTVSTVLCSPKIQLKFSPELCFSQNKQQKYIRRKRILK